MRLIFYFGRKTVSGQSGQMHQALPQLTLWPKLSRPGQNVLKSNIRGKTRLLPNRNRRVDPSRQHLQIRRGANPSNDPQRAGFFKVKRSRQQTVLQETHKLTSRLRVEKTSDES
jgi:hypothetical protein